MMDGESLVAKVMKFGGASLRDSESVHRVAELIRAERTPVAVVVSALNGVTARLERALIESVADESFAEQALTEIRGLHEQVLAEACGDDGLRREAEAELGELFCRLERLFYSTSYTEEVTPVLRDLVLSYGERLSARIMAAVLDSLGHPAQAFDADAVGIITDGEFGKATVVLAESCGNLRQALGAVVRRGVLPVVTGYFGRDSDGRTTTFGRGGSDYTAAVLARALRVRVLEIWKDVDGFLSADPALVSGARLIEELSYGEAAELAYFGACIIHPRTVQPLAGTKIPIHIRNTFRPGGPGTIVTESPLRAAPELKSIALTREVGLIKAHGSWVGERPEVLGHIVQIISGAGINIKSVITSQTCITLLLEAADLERAYYSLVELKHPAVERYERIDGVSMVALVGEGIMGGGEITGRAITAVSAAGARVQMISSGATEVACYLIVRSGEDRKVVQAIHDCFFSCGDCSNKWGAGRRPFPNSSFP